MEKNTLSNSEIYEILKSEILNLSLYPGMIIGENEVSKRFEVSRTPIREVFKRLEYDQLIRPIIKKGTMITPINLSNITDMMFVREKLEVGMIEEIISCIQDSDLMKLQVLIIKQRKVIEDTTTSLTNKALDFYSLDTQFHELLFSFANKRYVWDTIVGLMPDYQRFRIVSSEFHNIDLLWSFLNYHQAIYEAIEHKDMVKIRELYREHIYQGKSLFKEMLEQKEEYFVI